jgi:hypothetical protein
MGDESYPRQVGLGKGSGAGRHGTKAVPGKLGWERCPGPGGLGRKLSQASWAGKGVWGQEAWGESCQVSWARKGVWGREAQNDRLATAPRQVGLGQRLSRAGRPRTREG